MIHLSIAGIFIMLMCAFVGAGEYLIDKMEGVDWDVR